jgi:hypothetical protein
VGGRKGPTALGRVDLSTFDTSGYSDHSSVGFLELWPAAGVVRTRRQSIAVARTQVRIT